MSIKTVLARIAKNEVLAKRTEYTDYDTWYAAVKYMRHQGVILGGPSRTVVSPSIGRVGSKIIFSSSTPFKKLLFGEWVIKDNKTMEGTGWIDLGKYRLAK